jgi:hypothetical protein
MRPLLGQMFKRVTDAPGTEADVAAAGEDLGEEDTVLGISDVELACEDIMEGQDGVVRVKAELVDPDVANATVAGAVVISDGSN